MPGGGPGAARAIKVSHCVNVISQAVRPHLEDIPWLRFPELLSFDECGGVRVQPEDSTRGVDDAPCFRLCPQWALLDDGSALVLVSRGGVDLLDDVRAF